MLLAIGVSAAACGCQASDGAPEDEPERSDATPAKSNERDTGSRNGRGDQADTRSLDGTASGTTLSGNFGDARDAAEADRGTSRPRSDAARDVSVADTRADDVGAARPDSATAEAPPADAASKMAIFLLIGQSNMAGGAKAESQDHIDDPRIRVLGYDTCRANGRKYNTWANAEPSLHSCGSGVGPGDSFAKRIAEAWPTTTIGLVPCAIPGVDIDFFRKNVVSRRRGEFWIPPDNHWSGAYEWVVERARLAQASGRIRGIIFHQGESDGGSPQWLGKVQEMVRDLRSDLELGGDVGFVAGELLYSGCCSSHNRLVNQIPDLIPRSAVASASGLAGVDAFHFDLPGVRLLGRRFGDAMLTLLERP